MELVAAAQLSTLSLPQLVRIQNKLLENYLSKNSSDPLRCEIMILDLPLSNLWNGFFLMQFFMCLIHLRQ